MTVDTIDRKLANLLRLFDRDGDGSLHAVDYERWVARLASIRGWARESEPYGALEALFLDFSERLEASLGNEHGLVPIPPVTQILKTLPRIGASELTAWAEGLFGLLDADGDGVIGPQEYRSLLQSVYVDGPTADESFARLTGGGGDRLSRAEFTDLYLEFFTSDDPDAPGSWFWGPF